MSNFIASSDIASSHYHVGGDAGGSDPWTFDFLNEGENASGEFTERSSGNENLHLGSLAADDEGGQPITYLGVEWNTEDLALLEWSPEDLAWLAQQLLGWSSAQRDVQLLPPQTGLPGLQNNSSPFVASGSSSLLSGAIRTAGTSRRNPTPYAQSYSPPHIVLMASQPAPFLPCHWKGCSEIFPSLADLEHHVLRPKQHQRHVSTHNLVQGHSKKISCQWGTCSASVYGIWRHIPPESHINITFYCASCDTWNSRQHSCP